MLSVITWGWEIFSAQVQVHLASPAPVGEMGEGSISQRTWGAVQGRRKSDTGPRARKSRRVVGGQPLSSHLVPLRLRHN